MGADGDGSEGAPDRQMELEGGRRLFCKGALWTWAVGESVADLTGSKFVFSSSPSAPNPRESLLHLF